MAFTQEIEPDLTARMMSRVVARSPLTDIAEGGVAHGMIKTVGEELAALYAAVQDRLNTRFLDQSGTDLDDACNQLPRGGVQRIGKSPAAGSVLKITRQGTSGDLVVPIGTTYGRTDDPTLVYYQTGEVTILDGQSSYGTVAAYVPVVCTTLGEIGNCPTGSIDRVLNGPDTLIRAEQMLPLTTGSERETDAQLQTRAFAYWTAITTPSTKSALRYLALSFQSSTGARAKFASFYGPTPDLPGYVELIVDDGEAFEGQTRPGVTQSGTLLNGQRRVYLEGPIVADNLTIAEVEVDGATPAEVSWSLVSEGGELWFDPGYAEDGMTWQVSGYSVYTGFVAELQQVVFGLSTSALNGLGWGAAGCRIRVRPPTVQQVVLSVRIVLFDGYDLDTVGDAVIAALSAYCSSLAPGAPFQIMNAYAAMQAVPGVRNATFLDETTPDSGTAVAAVTVDTYPSSERHSIRLSSSSTTTGAG